jgi:glucose-1-phosphatase
MAFMKKQVASRRQAAEQKRLAVFDIGNVLLAFSFDRVIRNFERVQPGTGITMVRDLWFSPMGRKLETGRVSGRELFRHLKRKRGLRMSYAEFRRGFNDIFTPMTPNLRLLRDLSRRVPVAILSNTNAIHWAYIFKHYPPLRCVQWPYSSHLAGFMKPDPRIFRALSRRTGVPLKNMVYVDDLIKNVKSARRLGLTAFHYTGTGSLRPFFYKSLFSKNHA